MLLRPTANDGIETFLDESLTAPNKKREMKNTDFVTLNNGNLLSE